jgi:hypothetical protein
MQIGIIFSLMRDVIGASLSPKEVALAYSRQDDFGPAKRFGKCKIIFNGSVKEFIFDATWLDTSAELGNSTTYALVESLATRLAGPKRNLLARKLPTQSPLANL